MPVVDTHSLWLVLLRDKKGTQRVQVWRAPAGRDGLRRIFRVREEDSIPVAATTMDTITQAKIPMQALGRWQKMMRGDWQAIWVNTGREIPDMVAVQAQSPAAAMRLAEEKGYAPTGGATLDEVKLGLGRMQEILHQVGNAAADRDLILNPPRNHVQLGPSQQELAAIAWQDQTDVWKRAAGRG